MLYKVVVQVGRLLVFLATTTLTPSSIASAEGTGNTDGVPQVVNRIDEIVGAELSAQRFPGYAVAVIKNGRVLVQKGYGFANVENGVRVTSNTVFGLASLTKAFTAICLLSLVEQGKNPFRRYAKQIYSISSNFLSENYAASACSDDRWGT
jgi:CubicO group peptidase (beta-lactamase class C family)